MHASRRAANLRWFENAVFLSAPGREGWVIMWPLCLETGTIAEIKVKSNFPGHFLNCLHWFKFIFLRYRAEDSALRLRSATKTEIDSQVFIGPLVLRPSFYSALGNFTKIAFPHLETSRDDALKNLLRKIPPWAYWKCNSQKYTMLKLKAVFATCNKTDRAYFRTLIG